MKNKKSILFSDYKIAPAENAQKELCIQKAQGKQKQIKREKGLFAQMRTQAEYMGKWFWLGLPALLLTALFLLRIIKISSYGDVFTMQLLMLLSSIGPLLASISAPVLARSYSHDMWELEESAMFNLPRLTSIRLILCFFASLPVIVITGLATLGTISFFHVLAALLIPFFVANTLNYFILGRLRGNAGSLCCIGACLVLAFLFWGGAFNNKLLTLFKMNSGNFALMLALIICGLAFAFGAKNFVSKSTSR